MYENCTDHLSIDLSLKEISIFIAFQILLQNKQKLTRKRLSKNDLWSKPILIISNNEFKILRRKPGDEAFRVSFKFPWRGWDQSLADFNRFSNIETRSCYSCLVLQLHGFIFFPDVFNTYCLVAIRFFLFLSIAMLICWYSVNVLI